jgi:fructose-specific phosphotransferase system IIA component
MDMRLTSLINEDLIELDLKATKKEDVILEMVGLLEKARKVTDKEIYFKTVIERENLGSTGIGKGIAIPHGKSDVITEVAVAFGRSNAGIDFDSLDDRPVNLTFLLAAPKNVGGVYLKALAQLSRLLRQQDFRESLISAKTKTEVLEILSKADQAEQ